MEINILDGYKSANELTQQLITLATGVIALSITFTKDILTKPGQKVTLLVKLSWLSYLLSVCFGIWAMMTLTGMIFRVSLSGVTDAIKENPYGSSFLPSLLQILTFILGTVLIILYGINSLKDNIQTSSEDTPPLNDSMDVNAEQRP